jgi:ELWxxDGT repeat protein
VSNEWHLYKLALSLKTFEKLGEFDNTLDPSFLNDSRPLNDPYLLFAASTTAHGHELWRTDGTIVGTVMIKDINPGPNNGIFVNSFSDDESIKFKGFYYFSAENQSGAKELWKTDGTENGTTQVTSLNSTPSNSYVSPQNFKILDDYFLFSLDDTIYQLNSTGNSTTPSDLSHLSSFNSTTIFNNKILFVEYDHANPNGPTNKISAYDSDTSTLHTLSDILDAQGSHDILSRTDDKIYYLKRDSGNIALYSTQGTLASTQHIADIIGDGSATDIRAEFSYYHSSGTIILVLDHLNNDVQQVYKINGTTVTNITATILSQLNVTLPHSSFHFLNQTSTFGYDSFLKLNHLGEYKLMIMTKDSNGNDGDIILAKTSDFSTFTEYHTADPTLVIDFATQLKHFTAPIYGKFYYGSSYYQVDGVNYPLPYMMP